MINIFNELIKKIFDKNIRLIQLREKKINEENIFCGDYDYFIPKSELDSCLEIIFDTLSENCINFSIDTKKYAKTKIIIYDKEDTQKFIHLEFWNHLEVKDPSNKTSKYIFEDTLNKFITKNENNYAFSIEIEALFYLSHLYTKSKSISLDEVNSRIKFYKTKIVKNIEVANLYAVLKSDGDIAKCASNANKLLIKAGVLNKKTSFDTKVFVVKLKKELIKFKTKILKIKKIIPIVGPDGVGKTTLIEGLVLDIDTKSEYYRFKKLFRKSIIYNIMYRFLKKKLNKIKNKKNEKNEVDDYYGVFIIFSALTHYPLLVLSSLFRNKIIFSDRYFHDFILKDARFEDEKISIRYSWKSLLCITPDTYWFIQLDAPAQTILSRKQEMSENDINAYRKLMFKLYLAKPSIYYTYVNTKNNLEKCKNVLEAQGKDNGMFK